jgi:hypothetical protein
VTYRRADVAAAKIGWGGIGDTIRAQVSPQGLDAYIVLMSAASQYGTTNQSLNGLGIIEGSGGIRSNYHFLFALYEVSVIDGNQFSPLGRGFAFLPRAAPSWHSSTIRIGRSISHDGRRHSMRLPISSLGDALVFPRARVLPAMIDQNSELRLRNVQLAHMGHLRLQGRDRGCEPPCSGSPDPPFWQPGGKDPLDRQGANASIGQNHALSGISRLTQNT